MANYSDIKYQPAGSATTTYSDMAALIAATGMSAGDQALVTALNKVFMYTGSAWYLVATMTNDSPTAITGVDGTYTLATDGTATTVTAVSTDPEGFPLTWSYAVTTGSLGSTATVSQTDNVFTITPSTTEADAGSFSITFSVTDGETGAVSAVSAFTLSFIVTNSRYTALSVKATNTGSNQTFDDASTSNHTITASGDVTASTFSPYRHGGYSAYFDGTGDYLTLSPQSDFAFGTGDFSISLWVYFNDAENYDYLIDGRNSGQTTDTWSLSINFTNGASNKLMFASVPSGGSATAILTSDTDFVTGQWYYITVSRSGTTSRMHFNGTQVAINTSDSTNYSTSPNTSYIGTRYSLQQYFDGYMCDVRVVKGTALSSYTPPTAPLTAITNTKFLLGRLPYFKDQSASNHAITPNGNVSLEPISLFDNASYSEASHGASAYFDGTGDYLTLSPQSDFAFGTGDFSISLWVYFNNVGSYDYLIDGRNSGQTTDTWTLTINYTNTSSGKLMLGSGNSAILTSDTNFIANQWYYITVSRSGTTSRMHFNGTQVAINTSDSTNYSTAPNTSYIGVRYNLTNYFNGYISDVRVVKGSALSSYTPPAAPLTAITNTKFLLNPETSISDLSQSSAITCVGDAATDATTVKFAGTKSIAFDGTGDYLSISNFIDLGTDSWTIEGWYWFDNFSTSQGMFTVGRNAGCLAAMIYNTDKVRVLENNVASLVDSNTSVSAQSWTHIAITFTDSDNTIRIFINGNLDSNTGTKSSAWSFTDKTFQLGARYYSSAIQVPMTGYVQDFRITKGLARYTANFTPPTAELNG